jgi:uncharacterized protein YjaZ
MRIFNCTLLFLGSLLFLTSCGHDRLDVDTGNVSVPDITIKRLDQDLFLMDTSAIEKESEKLQAKYGHFYSIFISRIINNGDLRDSSYSLRLKQFIFDRDMRETFETVSKLYSNTDTIKKEIADVFAHFKYYFPERKLPAVVTMISGYNSPVVSIDSTLALGLEMYMGSSNKFYQMAAFPRYKTLFMNKSNLVPDAAREWMINEFPYNMNKSDFLSEIVYVGKIMYLMDALMPEVNDTVKIKYTQKQMDYCTQNEFNVWSYFAAQKLLFTTDQAEIMKFTAEGPFTSALSKESAPRIGYWIGWQIVKQYMKTNSEITIEQLMSEPDAQKILTKAKYKPAK